MPNSSHFSSSQISSTPSSPSPFIWNLSSIHQSKSHPMKNILIYGSSGALGKSLVKTFNKHNWATIGIDLTKNLDLHHSIIMEPSTASFEDKHNFIKSQLDPIIKSTKLDGILCVAGGWYGGSLSSPTFLSDANKINHQSLKTSLISAKLAYDYLKPNHLLLLTGAYSALNITPTMLAYGVYKNAVHQLARSLHDPSSDFRGKCVCILPRTLDTKANRDAMPTANFKNWTDLDVLSDKIYQWSLGNNLPLKSPLLEIETRNGETFAKEID